MQTTAINTSSGTELDTLDLSAAPPLALDDSRLLPMTLTLQRLASLMLDEDDYDEEFLRPSRAAYDFAFRVIAEAHGALPRDVPRATPAPMGDGGIFVEWRRGSRLVRLIVPPDPAHAYLYAEEWDHVAERALVSPDELTQRLKWLLQQ